MKKKNNGGHGAVEAGARSTRHVEVVRCGLAGELAAGNMVGFAPASRDSPEFPATSRGPPSVHRI